MSQSKVSCVRTQCSASARAQIQTVRSTVQGNNHTIKVTLFKHGIIRQYKSSETLVAIKAKIAKILRAYLILSLTAMNAKQFINYSSF